MPKYKFSTEFEFNASEKMIYPYLTTPSGLSEWFVDKVTINEDKNFLFHWQNEDLVAKLVVNKPYDHVKFEFITKSETDSKPNYIEFKLNFDEMTTRVYLKVIDFSEMDDEIELQEMWDNFMKSLREKIGC